MCLGQRSREVRCPDCFSMPRSHQALQDIGADPSLASRQKGKKLVEFQRIGAP